MHRNDFDAIVVGAGPAGSVAAHELARRDRRVLLVDRDEFPRYKVCGGCLSNSSMPILESLGVRNHLLERGSQVFTAVRLYAHRKQACIQVPPGLSVSRELLDQLLVQKAEEAGATFISKTVASLEAQEADCCRVKLRRRQRNNSIDSVSSSILLIADGLGNQFFRNCDSLRSQPEYSSRIGLGMRVEGQQQQIPGNTIQMCVAKDAYVGVARIEKGNLNIAAAIDVEFLKKGSPGEMIKRVLEDAGLPLDFVPGQKIKGTPQLTHKRSAVSDHRVFILGDSAGYVEPFTGEGMTWAMQSALLLAPIANRAIAQWDGQLENRWSECHRRYMARRQLMCRAISRCLRNKWFNLFAINLASIHSYSFSLAAKMIHHPPTKRTVRT